jgi:hypothetical protein
MRTHFTQQIGGGRGFEHTSTLDAATDSTFLPLQPLSTGLGYENKAPKTRI